MGKLGDKVVIVTGAASGIGLATSKRLLADGATVVGADLGEGPGALGGRWTYVPTDVTDEGATEALVAAAVVAGGRLDGIVTDRHSCDAIALEDSEVCVMPFHKVEELSREFNSLQHHVHKIMSREIVRDQSVMMLLGGMRAEVRLAAFLLNLVQRLNARGFSKSELVLRMTREEIGNYLGMKLETVSRTFSKFVEDGLIEVRQRYVQIVDADGLRLIVNEPSCSR
jgi:CRP-like cAMP-binding protein